MFEPRRCAPSSEGAERYGHLLDSIRFVARGVLEKHHLRICGRARSSPCGRRATGDQMRILYAPSDTGVWPRAAGIAFSSLLVVAKGSC
jgi:hypothetical protein